MAGTREFLQHVLPHAGPYCIVAQPPEGFYQHYAAESIEQAASIADFQDRQGKNVLVAVGALIKAMQWDARQERMRCMRGGDNIRGLRAYTMDIDAGPRKKGDPYDDTPQALAALKAFCQHASLPKPTITQSGFGLHVWWTLTEEVPEATWEHYGKALSSMAKAFGLRHDSARTTDSSSILRVVGAHNHKYEAKPEVVLLAQGVDTAPESFHALLSHEAPPTGGLNSPAPTTDFGDSNTSRYDRESLSGKLLVQNCAAFARVADPEQQALGREGVPEPAWSAAIDTCTHAKNGLKIAHDISRFDPRYDAEYVDKKFEYKLHKGVGPATCARMEKAWGDFGVTDVCIGCPSKDKITSPAQVSHRIEVRPPLVVKEVVGDTVVEREITAPPKPYVRVTTGIGLHFANPKTGADDVQVFCPYDMYPLRMSYNEQTRKSDGATWMVNMPREGWTELVIPHTANKNTLTLELAKLGVHINPNEAELMGRFMSAYLRKLQNEVAREMEYMKMGWRDDRGGGFFLGDTLFTKGGTTEKHMMSDTLRASTSGSVRTAGDRDLWVQAACMYNRPTLEAFRTVLYTSLAGPLYSLTGHGATCFNASGAGGIGKTTILKVAAGMWGDWQGYFLREVTQVASEAVASAFNNLPVMIDEMTMKGAKETADFVFRFSGGKGKSRGKEDGGLRENTKTWSTLCISNANSDMYASMSVVHRDASPHIMRLVQIEFPAISGALTKNDGDWITGTVTDNFGWVGREYVAYLAQHKTAIKDRIKKATGEIGKLLGDVSEERFWYSWAACCRVAAEIAFDLEILPNFPITADMEWIVSQIKLLRANAAALVSTSAEMIGDFLDEHVGGTLVLSSKTSSNIDNVVVEPHGELVVRKELDLNRAFVSRSALQRYASERDINLARAMMKLLNEGVVVRDQMLKTLGADTKYAAGRVRCVEIDLNKLAGKPALVVANPTPAAPAVAAPVAAVI